MPPVLSAAALYQRRRSRPSDVSHTRFIAEYRIVSLQRSEMLAAQAGRCRVMTIRLATLAALWLLVTPAAGWADDASLIGTWRLKSFVREITATGERYNQLGEHPEGYLGYAKDGRMYAILVAGERVKPREQAPTDEEALALYRSMITYAGTYSVEGNKVTHHVDISWNGARTGSDQVRFFTLDGDTLTIKTDRSKSPIDGRE